MSPQEFGLTKAAYDVKEASCVLSLGKTSLYEAVKKGTLKVTKMGKKNLFLAIDLAAYLEHLIRER